MASLKSSWTSWLAVLFAHSMPTATSIKMHMSTDITDMMSTEMTDMITYTYDHEKPSHRKSKDDKHDYVLQLSEYVLDNMSNVSNLTTRAGYGPYWCGSGYSDTCGIDAKYWGCGWRCPRAAPWTNGACGCCCVADTASPTAFPTPDPTSYPTPQPTSSPTAFPTPYPTPQPTYPAPAASAAGMGGASATGDPHLQNVHGERFDLMKPGNHLLIRIPRKSSVSALLRVDAEAQRLGGHCADLYFQELNITGAWASSKQIGGFHYLAQDVDDKPSHWVHFGNVQMKVAHGRTSQGIKYINFYVRDLARSGFSVGGLLGDDDHTEAAMPPEDCVHRLAL